MNDTHLADERSFASCDTDGKGPIGGWTMVFESAVKVGEVSHTGDGGTWVPSTAVRLVV